MSGVDRSQSVVLVLALALSVALGFAVPGLEVSTEAALVFATGVVLAVPIAVRISRGTFDLFEPMTAFLVTYSILFVVRPAYMYINDVDFFQIASEVAFIGDTLIPMQLAALLGAIGFVVGYELTPGRRAAAMLPVRGDVPIHRMANAALGIFILGALGTLLYVSAIPGGFQTILAGRTESLSQSMAAASGYLVFAPSLLIPASLLYVATWFKSGRASHLVLALAAASILIAVRGPVGGRIALLPLLGGLVVFLFLIRNRRPALLTVIVAVSIGLFIWTFLGQVRNEATRTAEGTGKVAQGLLQEPIKLIDPITIGQDAGMAPSLAAGMSVIPDKIDFTYGTGTLSDLAVRGIPRSFWPEKPLPVREQFVSLVWRDGYNRGLANPEPSVLFSFYAEMGFIGVVLGMGILGFMLKALWRYFLENRSRILVVLIYSIFFASIPIILRDGLTDSLVKIGFTLVPLLAVGLTGPRIVKSRK